MSLLQVFFYRSLSDCSEREGLILLVNLCYTIHMNNAEKTTVFFVRHGDVDNPDHVFYGTLPFSLSEKGREQVQKLVPFFKKKNIAALYASPIQRVQETAEILGEGCGLPVTTDKRLTESEMFASWEGLSAKSLSESHLKDWQTFKTTPSELNIKGHTMNHLAERMQVFLKEILEKHTGESVIAVSHGDPIKTLFCVIEGRPIDDIRTFQFNYGGIISVESNGQVVSAKIINDGDGDFSIAS